jgi:hypothetical protein
VAEANAFEPELEELLELVEEEILLPAWQPARDKHKKIPKESEVTENANG